MRGKPRKRVYPRRWMGAAAFFAVTSLAAMPLPKAWSHWRYSRAIQLPPTETRRLVSVAVPQDVYPQALAGLPDIRVIDDLGAEVPFARFAREGSTNSVSLATMIHENSFSPGKYTQLVLDAGEKAPFHNAVKVNASETDFIEWVHVEASDDAHLWRIVQERAPIFHFQKEGREGTQTVNYSENNARYLRVQILEREKQFLILGANLLYKTVEAPERAPLAVPISPDPSAPPGETAWRVDLGAPPLSVTEVRFGVAPAEFSRNVEISASDDGARWDSLAQGQIYRFHQGDAAREELSVSFCFCGDKRYLRVAILNGNDASLPSAVPTLYMTPQHAVFEQQPGRSYRMLYGQSEAKSPQYDLERRVDAKQEEAAVAGQFGTEEINAAWSDPRPWTEQHGMFLWVVLGIAVALLVYSALRSLRRSTTTPTSGT